MRLQENWIASFRFEVARVSAYISCATVFLLTDEAGVTVDAVRLPEETSDPVAIGLHLADKRFGTNAVARSMEEGRPSLFCGEAKACAVFQSWNSAAAPVFRENVRAGYVALFFPGDQGGAFSVALAQQLAFLVAHGAASRATPDSAASLLEAEFGKYKLSPREREIALCWYQEKSALYIAAQLGIREGTVRNVLNHIYTKMNVRDRTQFIRKLTPLTQSFADTLPPPVLSARPAE